MIISLSALITAAVSVVVSVWLGIANQNHQKLSVKPYMVFHEGWNHEQKTLGISISNQGLGLARVFPFFVYVDGELVNGWDGAIAKLGIDNKKDWITYMDITSSAVPWKEGVEEVIFGLRLDSEDDSAQRRDVIYNSLPRINVVSCFCSLYKECEQVTLRSALEGLCEKVFRD